MFVKEELERQNIKYIQYTKTKRTANGYTIHKFIPEYPQGNSFEVSCVELSSGGGNDLRRWNYA